MSGNTKRVSGVKRSFGARGAKTKFAPKTVRTYLVIVESPSKIAKIEEYLGSDYAVVATCGHLCTLNHLKDIGSDFEATYTNKEDKAAHIAHLRDVIGQYPNDRVLLGTDNDREGEAIAFHVCRIFGLPVATTPRILFNEITRDALLRAVLPSNRTHVRMGLVRSQQARQVIDLWIGFKVSPLLWKHLYYSKTRALSAGRCQTPALCLLHDHQRSVEGDAPSSYYHTVGHFFSSPFTLACTLNHRFTAPDEAQAFLDASRTFSHTVQVGEKKRSVRAPPKPLHTSAMLQLAHAVLHYTPKTTTQLAQLLYQGGHITYLRTDARTYAQEFLDKARTYVAATYGDPYVGDLDALLSAKAQPHEAIRVTQLSVKSIPVTEDPRLNTLYQLLWRHTVESCMAAAQFDVHAVTVQAPERRHYSATIDVPVFRGWQACAGDKDQKAKTDQLLYARSLTSTVPWTRIESTVAVERRSPHYTQAGLIQTLEDYGIGRPSTYATFVDTLLDKGYVANQDVPGTTLTCQEFRLTPETLDVTTVDKTLGAEKNKLVIQPLGIQVCTFLRQHFDALFAYSYTQSMEEALDKIETGAASYHEVCRGIHDDLSAWVQAVPPVRKGGDIALTDGNAVTFTAHGPRVRIATGSDGSDGTDGAAVDYVPLVDGVALDTLASRSADQVAAYPTSHLGKYGDHEVRLCTGKYGPFLAWGDQRCSLRGHALADLTLDDAVSLLTTKTKVDAADIARQVSDSISVRNGKYGPYLYCTSATSARPTFVSLKAFRDNYLTCDPDLLIQYALQGNAKNKGARRPTTG